MGRERIDRFLQPLESVRIGRVFSDPPAAPHKLPLSQVGSIGTIRDTVS